MKMKNYIHLYSCRDNVPEESLLVTINVSHREVMRLNESLVSSNSGHKLIRHIIDLETNRYAGESEDLNGSEDGETRFFSVVKK